jgi:MFS family permease
MSHAQAAPKPAELAPDWAAIFIVVFGVSAFAVAQGLTYPLLSLLMERRGVPALLIGLNAGSFAAGLAAATLLVHRLTQMARGDRLIIGALVGVSACLSMFAATDNLAIWFVARFLLGFFVSVIYVLSEAWLNEAAPDRIRGRVSGFYGASICIGFAAGPLAIPLLGTESGLPFAIMAVYIAAVAFCVGIVSRRARTQPAHAPTGAMFEFVRRAPVLAAMVLAFGFADIAAVSAMPVYFVRTGYSEAFAALSITVMTLPTAVAQPFVGLLLDKVSRRLVAASCGAIAALAYLSVPFLSSEIALLAAFVLIGAASFSLYTCALTLLGQHYSGALLLGGSAAYALSYAIGSAAGSAGTGAVMDLFGPAAAPALAGLVLVAFTALFLSSRRNIAA